MAVGKRRAEFFMRKIEWTDALSVALGKDHFAAHVAIVIGRHMNSDTGETFVGRETIADLIGGHRRTVEIAIQKLELLGFLSVKRDRGRGRANTYVMTFPEKAAPTPPITQEKAGSTPSLSDVSRPLRVEEKAVGAELKGGENDRKRRQTDRSNLKEPNLKELTLGEKGFEGIGGAAAPVQLTARFPASISLPVMNSDNRPRTFANRGQFEQILAGLLGEHGVDGWEVLGSLEDHKVNALCRRLKNKVLSEMEIAEVAIQYRKSSKPALGRISTDVSS